MRISPSLPVLIPVLFPLTSFTFPTGRAASAQSGPQDCGHHSATVLRLANSDDGLNFSDSGQVFLQQAASPDLIRLPNGHLLAIFEHCPGAQGRLGLYVTRSTDSARSWSEAQPIVLRGPGAGRIQPDRPTLAMMRDRSLRIYFRMRDPEAAERQPTIIGSAVTRNGLEYEYDRAVQIKCELGGDVRLCAAWLGRRLHLFAVATPQAANAPAEVAHWFSYDGRRFFRLTRAKTEPAVTDIIALDRTRFRALTTAGGDIRSMLTADGSEWRQEAGVRMLNAAGPSVVSLDGGKFLMLYSRAMDANSQSARELIAAAEGAQSGAGQTGQGASAGQTGETARGQVPAGWEPFGTGATPGTGANAAAGEIPATPFPPKPDFQTRIDYVEWLRQNLVVPVDQNAYDLYVTFCSAPGDAEGAKPLWPDPNSTIDDMFNGDYSGQPFPWNPGEYPNWEATRQKMQPLLDKFSEAVQVDAYSMPLVFTPQQYADAPEGRPLLFELLLPSLGQHRKLVKLTMADAWRGDNGQLSPERMMAGWETAFRGASHMLQGPTLIHRLVGVAEQSLVENTARRALTYGAFSETQLEQALNTLGQYDRPQSDPTTWIAMESAMAMDALQSLVVVAPDGQARVDTARMKRLGISSSQQSSQFDVLKNLFLGGLSTEGLRQDAEKLDAYYREIAEAFATGYPQVRAADMKKREEKYMEDAGILSRSIAPSFRRAHQMMARNEANRRATQLSYALHLYAARNGQWPTSLDQLGPDCGGIRTDPFTGNDFGYQLTAEGPKVYSLSENTTDDGGVHSKRWDDTEPTKGTGGSDDYVFWPPQE